MNWNRVLLVSAVAAGLVSVLPSRFTTAFGLRDGLRAGMVIVALPVQAPFTWIIRSARGSSGQSGADATGAALAQLEAQEWKKNYLTAMQENQSLRDQINALGRTQQLNVSFITRETSPLPVLGLTDQLLLVRAAASLNIPTNAVAVADRVHLVGRVASIDGGGRIARVQPISGLAAAEIKGVILDSERFESPESTSVTSTTLTSARVRVSLKPTGRGTLSGLVFIERGSEPGAMRVQTGMVVRLLDESWAAADQMLILGRVIRAEEAPNGRTVVEIQPAIDPYRVSSLTIRFSSDAASGGSGGPER
ncbi:MAG: hypothetical protein K2X32_01185 [Phycisphaerales bacterium]|nr:hypothetical protein [Phycisphaerales bacterium]